MKTLILSILFFAVATNIQAQWNHNDTAPQKHFLYTSGEYIVGESNGGNLGLNYIFDNKYSLSIGYVATNKADRTLPDQYLKSTEKLVAINPNQPFQNLEDFHLLLGRVINLTENNNIRLILQGGPGISNFREPIFTVTGNQYNHTIQTTKKLCFVLNPKIELPLSSTLGFSVGPMIVINNEEKYAGIGIGLMYGVLRNGKS